MAEVMGDNKVAIETVSASSSVESIAGVIAVVLGILTLVNVLPQLLVDIAVIALGAGLLVRGGGVVAEYSSLTSAVPGRRALQSELGVGAGVEALTGVAGIVLGVLALLGLIPEMLISIAVITLGAGVLMSSLTNLGIDRLKLFYNGIREAVTGARWRVRASSFVQFLIGAFAIALGILALFDIPALHGVGTIVLGVGAILAGMAAGGRGGNVRSGQHPTG